MVFNMQTEQLEGFKLSPQQKRLWLLQQSESTFPYRVKCAVTVTGNLNLEILKIALESIVERYEILRTNFNCLPGMTVPLQVISDASEVNIYNFNFTYLPFREQESKIKSIFTELTKKPFELENNILFHVNIIILSPIKHILMLSLSALIADSFTLKKLLEEISSSYAACLQDKYIIDDPMQYADIAEWQNELLDSNESKLGKEYWHEKYVSSSDHLKLWFEKKQSTASQFQPQHFYLQINNASLEQIELLANTYQVNKSDLLLVCWLILLWKITRQSNIAVGITANGRKYEELEQALGPLSKVLPLSYHLEAEFKFSEILKEVNKLVNNAREWQEYFTWQENVNLESFCPVGFEFEKYPENYSAGNLLFSLDQQYSCIDKFKIKLTCLQKNDTLIAQFYFDSQLYDLHDIQILSEQFQNLLSSAIENSESSIGRLNILDNHQRQQLLIEFNNTQKQYSQYKCVHQLFEAQAIKTPNNIAVVCDSEQLTYSELNSKADLLANHLKQLGVKPDTLVGLYLDRSHLSIIGLLGILKAGAAYLPLDSTLPAEGLAFRLQDAGVSVLLTQRSLLSKIPENTEYRVCLDTNWETIAENQDSSHSEVQPDNLVYAIYTSGSTGTPKAVAVEHRQLVNYLYSIVERLDILPDASFATVSTLAADLGNTMLFPALCTGGCLYIIDQETATDPQAFSNYCQDHPIDYLKIVPSHLTALLSSSPETEFLPRKKLILGGEASNWQLISKIQQQQPNCQIFNHYGPTETTVGVLTYPIDATTSNESTTVPIGKPLPNNQVYVLDEQLQPVPIGVPGKLYIGGAQVSRGYLNRPELTKEKFTTNPFIKSAFDNSREYRLYKTGDKARCLPDGSIEFLGRIDRQVKIRGFRIELGEIETKLRQHQGIQSVVVTNEESFDNQRLIAYVATDPKFRLLHQHQDTAIASELRSFCINRFPEYMIPSTFVVLKALPLTANGKIDYQALPTLEQTRPELEQPYVAPRSPLEKQLAEIWTEVLGLEKIGIHDNFFEIGGHSLLLTQLLIKVRNALEVELLLKDLFNAPTIANLAEIIKETVEVNGKNERQEEKIGIDLHSEVILDSDIVPANSYQTITTKPNSILLTGATGFLGTFLLNELLQQTSADIYCLVRAENDTLAQKRIKNKLKSYLLWDESFGKRIIPVVGDLSQPLLGLSIDRFKAIAKSVDVIYHNGAWVNFTYPYSQLKATNVLGTHEILRLAVQSKIKPVHFISTKNVARAADRQLEIVREDTLIDRCEQIENGYAQSKWVAEKIVSIARDRGIPVSIYRPGRISGHSQTGVCNPDDHTFRMIRGCIQFGSVPQNNSPINLTPVDYAVGTIVHLSSQPESLGKTFHVFNPQTTPWNEVVNSIISFGYPLKQIDYQQWREQLLTAVERYPDNPLSPLTSIFAANKTANSNMEEGINQELDASNTYSGLTGTSIVCPKCDRQLLSTYFSFLIDQGFLIKTPVKNIKFN